MPRQINRAQEITFNIRQRLGVLETSQNGWTKEVNLVEWNNKPAKLDIREWDPEHEHMSKGITLRRSETLILLKILLRNFGRELADSKAQPASVKAERTSVPAPPGEFDDLCAGGSSAGGSLKCGCGERSGLTCGDEAAEADEAAADEAAGRAAEEHAAAADGSVNTCEAEETGETDTPDFADEKAFLPEDF